MGMGEVSVSYFKAELAFLNAVSILQEKHSLFLSLSALSYYLSRSDHSKMTVLARLLVSSKTLAGDTGHLSFLVFLINFELYVNTY